MDPPAEFKCPISMEVMKDPVICEDGITYEREVILKWLETSNVSPITRQTIHKQNIRSNLALRSLISYWKITQNRPSPSAPPPMLPYAAPVISTENDYVQISYQTHNPHHMPSQSTQSSNLTPQQQLDRKRKLVVQLSCLTILIFIIILYYSVRYKE